MLRNYFKIAWRNLWKHRSFSLIIVCGMAVAFAAAILLSVTAHQELTYDQFHENKDHIYQLYDIDQRPNGIEYGATMPVPMAPTLKNEYGDIVYITRWGSGEGEYVRYKDKELDLSTRAVDPDFLRMFSFPVVAGDKSPLKELNHIAITENCAKTLFGNEEAIGKTLEIQFGGEWRSMLVTAIVKNIPTNSSFKFDILTRFENFPGYKTNSDRWDNRNHEVFLQLNENVSKASMEKRLPAFSQKYMAGKIEDLKKAGVQPDAEGYYTRMKLIPLEDLHFTNISNTGAGVSRFYPYLLLLISAFILFIACVNFVNLSLARSFTRAKEIGIRKVMGALRWQLITQFWGEALIVSSMALLVGVGLAYWLLPYYQAIFYPGISMRVLGSPLFLAYLVLGFLFISLLAGGYPAWVVSAFNTVQTVKGKLATGKSNALRNTLMVVQFVLSSLLIICTFIAWQQLQYLRNKPLGFNKEEIISIPISPTLESEKAIQLMRTKLAQQPQVISITAADINMGKGRDGSLQTSIMGFDYKDKIIRTHWQLVDYDYLKTFGLQLVEGRDFSREYGTDSLALIINETMAKQLGEGSAVGALLPVEEDKNYTVIGVVKDFHFKSLHQEVAPLTLSLNHVWPLQYIFVRVQPTALASAMEMVTKAYKEIDPRSVFEASYLDENTDRQYERETKLSKIFVSGAVLTILISCMGLFAIVLLVIVQRTREIGIRKVLGASVPHIVALVSKDFIRLVALAIIIASPLAWYIMNQWLKDFAYRITIEWWVFVLAGLVAIFIAFITLSFQSVKAALKNPVKSLRTE
jgi:ABC-type antimicrobial peptide transport system, permease component